MPNHILLLTFYYMSSLVMPAPLCISIFTHGHIIELNEGIHLDLDTWIVPGQICKSTSTGGWETDTHQSRGHGHRGRVLMSRMRVMH